MSNVYKHVPVLSCVKILRYLQIFITPRSRPNPSSGRELKVLHGLCQELNRISGRNLSSRMDKNTINTDKIGYIYLYIIYKIHIEFLEYKTTSVTSWRPLHLLNLQALRAEQLVQILGSLWGTLKKYEKIAKGRLLFVEPRANSITISISDLFILNSSFFNLRIYCNIQQSTVSTQQYNSR